MNGSCEAQSLISNPARTAQAGSNDRHAAAA